MKAYGIPVQSVVWKQPTAASLTSTASGTANFIGTFVKTESTGSNPAGTLVRTITTTNSNNNPEADSTVVVTASAASGPPSAISVKQEIPDLEGCHLTSKQLEEFMDDDCVGPVTSGDPMLSSPHLSPHDVLPSPASSGSHYSANDDALTPDSMDLAV